ncbi:OLC1v1011288C2 [Oldenlandia corymbosa var. corymbosa]|uniref:OLC1v1011288C2 n=1 Tax=Oldenlandia corymbosa var. corymbosa TaxID=529605 RepID=A0AAV1DTJ6_OLDCO|nr:OLC1v1011288C2 [Oldenlandia corymbosa var. corymbosa]
MGKKAGGGGGGAEGENKEKEGQNLLGAPTFKEIENGRFKCVETGHELPAHARDSYSQSKHCRLGLIDAALANNKPPLNMFRQDPQSSSKLICKLTGFAINKTEEHIWKHINGKRFLHMLERMETGKGMPNGTEEHPEQKEGKKKKIKDVKKKKNKKEDKPVCEVISEVRDISVKDSDSEAGDDFWMPPAGERWDNDDGGDRWGSDTESGAESDGDDIEETEEVKQEAGELSSRYAILLVFDLLVSCKFA